MGDPGRGKDERMLEFTKLESATELMVNDHNGFEKYIDLIKKKQQQLAKTKREGIQ